MSDVQTLLQDLQSGRLPRRAFIGRALAAGVSLSSIVAMLESCGGSSGGGSSSSIKWSNWANTGELQRFRDFTADYNKKHNTNVQYTFIPSADNNYFSKILTELNGGVAPFRFLAQGFQNDVVEVSFQRTLEPGRIRQWRECLLSCFGDVADTL